MEPNELVQYRTLMLNRFRETTDQGQMINL